MSPAVIIKSMKKVQKLLNCCIWQKYNSEVHCGNFNEWQPLCASRFFCVLYRGHSLQPCSHVAKAKAKESLEIPLHMCRLIEIPKCNLILYSYYCSKTYNLHFKKLLPVSRGAMLPQISKTKYFNSFCFPLVWTEPSCLCCLIRLHNKEKRLDFFTLSLSVAVNGPLGVNRVLFTIGSLGSGRFWSKQEHSLIITQIRVMWSINYF